MSTWAYQYAYTYMCIIIDSHIFVQSWTLTCHLHRALGTHTHMHIYILSHIYIILINTMHSNPHAHSHTNIHVCTHWDIHLQMQKHTCLASAVSKWVPITESIQHWIHELNITNSTALFIWRIEVKVLWSQTVSKWEDMSDSEVSTAVGRIRNNPIHCVMSS